VFISTANKESVKTIMVFLIARSGDEVTETWNKYFVYIHTMLVLYKLLLQFNNCQCGFTF